MNNEIINKNVPDRQERHSCFLPLLLLASGLGLILLVQTAQAFQQHVAMQRQIDQLMPVAVKADSSQKLLQAMCMDILKLSADGNSDARELVQKFGINFNPPAPAPR